MQIQTYTQTDIAAPTRQAVVGIIKYKGQLYPQKLRLLGYGKMCSWQINYDLAVVKVR